ncbi:hypothetical protein [Paracraurococcus ruber]|uniref:Uncharacterized protein n=1 Tax=Paracraurococcus ruber TaxID=77675 RepID=A0ABS1CQX6_9PROT|nr:hypothetical protein [Paracraurococcus ruber]MBK1656830.1 hypothetical protein [Paracraurococcus ruber]TDG33946.1 hypothetical protein E2C05_01510 [Paracraurococcus ruber]
MSLERYYVGETARLRMTFADEAGAATDPTGLSVQARPPSGPALGGYAVVRESAGSYYVDLPVTLAGAWAVTWSWTGPVPSVTAQRFLAVPVAEAAAGGTVTPTPDVFDRWVTAWDAAALPKDSALFQKMAEAGGWPAAFFGVTPDTETDQGAALRALMLQVQQAGGGVIDLPPGVITTSRLDPLNGVFLRAQTLGAVTLKAVAGGGGVIFGNSNFASLVGTDDFSGLAPHDFGLIKLTFDGNAAQQSVASGQRDFACPVQVYGYRFLIDGYRYQNVVGHGLRTAWGRFGELEMAAQIRDVGGFFAPRCGFWFQGPHDSFIEKIVPVDSSQEAEAGWEQIRAGDTATWVDCHTWHTSFSTNKASYGFTSAGNSLTRNLVCEGSRALLKMGAGDQIDGLFFAATGSPGKWAVEVLGSAASISGGTRIINTTAADMWGIRLGTAGSPVGAVMMPGLIIGGWGRGAVDFAGDGGASRITATGYGNGTTRPAPNLRTYVQFDFNTPDLLYQKNQFHPGPFANQAAASAGGVQYGQLWLAADGTVRWSTS